MQEILYNSKLNLLDYFPLHTFKNLVKIFPRLRNMIPKNIVSNSQPIYIDKFFFYRMILEKIKNYFELNESFVISESIDVILKDIKSKDKEKISANKTGFPLINNFKNKSNTNLMISKELDSRNHSSKHSRNNNPCSPKFTPVRKIGNIEVHNNTARVSKIILDLEKKGDPKMKLVHFAEKITIDMNNINKKSKIWGKKSSLKSVNNRKPINLNINNNSNNNQNKTMSNKMNKNMSELKENNKPLIKAKTEYSMKNESTTIKKQEFEKSKEKVPMILTDRFKNIYEQNVNNFVNIDDKNFDIFEFENKVGKQNTLLLIGRYIFNYFKFGDVVNQIKYDNWVDKIAKGYNRKNFYHHDLHAADIAHTSYIYLRYGLIHEMAKLDTSMICVIIMSCICHDYKHPGVNNNFLIDTDNEIALNYNDFSVLENMHVSEAFKLMRTNPNCNVFEGFDKEKYKQFRKQMILCVLATDMTKHSSAIKFLNKLLSEDNKTENNDKQDYMNLVVHTADISNPTKKFDIYFNWAKLIVEEFYSQGDKEKKLGLKCSCDRTKVTIYKNQLGFIDFVELPFFGLVSKAFPKLDYLLVNLNDNKQRIKLLEEEYNKKNEKSN